MANNSTLFPAKLAKLSLKDSRSFEGFSFGAPCPVAGELVFNTGMVGYQESLTDPSYRGQILVITYPLVGNYGVPEDRKDDHGLARFESNQIQISALVVSEHAAEFSHHSAAKTLNQWLQENNVPGIWGVDTRAITKHLREHGSMLGRISLNGEDADWYDPNQHNLVADVSTTEVRDYPAGRKRIVVVDCGIKNSIIRSLLSRDISVRQVPWNHPFYQEEADGILISNGPGDPQMAEQTIQNIKLAMELRKPIFGICLGHQLLARAAGAQTFKLKFGHRSQNQPAVEVGTKRAFMTSQNHGYSVDGTTLPKDWQEWFINANDGSNEGIMHKELPFLSVQFHPEAVPGPVDSNYLFDKFISLIQ